MPRNSEGRELPIHNSSRESESSQSDRGSSMRNQVEKNPGIMSTLLDFVLGDEGADPDPGRLRREVDQFAQAATYVKDSKRGWGNHSARPTDREIARIGLNAVGYSPQEIERGGLIDKILKLIGVKS